MGPTGSIPLSIGAPIWPLDHSNFRVAKVICGLLDNEGHTEHQLLAKTGLEKMRLSMHPNCPEFVLIYSTLLPCMASRYDSRGNLIPGRKPRCIEEIAAAKQEFLRYCRDSFFYIYTDQKKERQPPTPLNKNFFIWEQQYMATNHITWLHP